MANVLTRRLLTRNVLKFKEYSTFATAHPSANFLLNKLDEAYGSSCYKAQNYAKSAVSFNIYYVPVKYYSSESDKKKDGERDCKSIEKSEKLSIFQRFKQMYRDYWYVLVPVHLVTSAAWLGGFYYLAKSGVDIVGILESMNVSEKITNSMKDSSMGYIAVSYALYKLTTPVRYAVTLGGTTFSINYLKKLGYIKPVPSKDRLVEMYQEKKDNLFESVRGTKEIYNEKKGNLMDSMRETKESLKLHKKDILEEKQTKK